MTLIDKEELIKELCLIYKHIGADERDIHFSLVDMKMNIDLMPTIEPVRHGHIKMDRGFNECSVCGNDDLLYGDKYCKNCGCKLDEVEE